RSCSHHRVHHLDDGSRRENVTTPILRTVTRTVELDVMDNAFQHVEVLKRNRTRRHQCGECFVEGVRPIQRLVDSRWRVASVWSDRSRPLSGWAEQIVSASGAERHYRLAPALMERLSDREEPSD